MHYDVICIDLWQTLAESPLSAIQSMADLCALPVKEILEDIKRTPIYLSRGDTRAFLEDYLTGRGIIMPKRIALLQEWEESVRKAYITEQGKAIIAKCSATGSPLALVSNVDCYGFENLPFRDDLLRHFPRRYLSFETGICKPNKRLLELIREDHSAIYPKMLFIGNDPLDDEAPAREVGIPFLYPSEVLKKL